MSHEPIASFTICSFISEFFCVFFILDYDSMFSEMDFTSEKSFSSN